MTDETSPRIEVVEPPQPERLPTNWWAFLVALVVGILFDLFFVREHGGAGYAVFFAVTSLLYVLGTIFEKSHQSRWLLLVMMLALSFRLLWLGSYGLLVAGFLLLPALAMSCTGLIPYLPDWWVFCLQSLVAALRAIVHAVQNCTWTGIRLNQLRLLGVVAPLLAVIIFGVVFIQANPDLAKSISTWLSSLERWVADWMVHWDFSVADFFCIAAIAWLVLGQLTPLMRQSIGHFVPENGHSESDDTQPSDLYVPIRNTLIAVNVLFVLYLVFEFQTLWFRDFPEGFYYAGYAHQGAAWLTLALGIATLMLSAIFHGKLLSDPRIGSLKRWTWGWSIANLLLAISVYNRLFIYIKFNGMTRMRMVGLFGISTVVVGFLLVVWKIRNNKRFVWLLQRHLWTLAIAVYLLLLTPVDYIVHSWNARQILAGHLAPAVQITEHPVDASGWLMLMPLLECENEIIREGVQARLSEFALTGVPVEMSRRSNRKEYWTRYQIVKDQLEQQLEQTPEKWQAMETREERVQAWNRFKEYAYQWY